MDARTKGTVKWFNDTKGFGFILVDGHPDVFIHHSSIDAPGFRTLKEGEEVEFTVESGPKGLVARGLTRLNPPQADQQ